MDEDRGRARDAEAGERRRGARAGGRRSGLPPWDRCRHCATPCDGEFCCDGCEQVHELLREGDLVRYYELREGPGQPAVDAIRPLADDAWLDVESARIAGTVDEPGDASLTLVALDVEGLHCTACVWLIEELFRRTGSAGRSDLNPALGTLDLLVERTFDLRAFAAQLARLGYKLGPRRKKAARASDALVLRMGVCVAIAMNSMLFAIARYAGLRSGAVEVLFRWLELGLAIAAFAVGGVVFVRAAAKGLRARVLHMDLPIAIGLVLGYAGSIASFLFADGSATYFDTLVVFTTLMLVGRYLRERVLEKNRAELLEDAGVDGLLVRRLDASGAGRVEIVGVRDVAVGDVLLVAPLDVLPLAGKLVDGAASMAFDWITGESEPRAFRAGDLVEAGAANHGRSAVRFEATETFATSRLLDLLRVPRAKERYGETESRFEARLARVWAAFVLVAAAGGFGAHLVAGASAMGALSVAVAILVVTCPCAFGIASPIAHELVLAGLRRRGMLIRSASFLERATRVRRVVFDKTGTLTTGNLALADANAVVRLDPADQRALYELAARSAHPKAAAILAAIPEEAQRLRPVAPGATATVEEIEGRGVVGTIDGHVYRLGSPAWLGAPAGCDVALDKDGALVATFTTTETLRTDAAREVRELADDGIASWIATGDAEDRAMDVARKCGVETQSVRAELSPEGKAALLEELDRDDTLMIGDGMNDGLAIRAAWCSGTLAVGRTFLAARSDFFLLSPGLGPVRAGLAAARTLRRTLRGNLVWAFTYNAIALGLSFAGWMSPLLAAVLMPASSIVSIALVLRALGRRGSPWKS